MAKKDFKVHILGVPFRVLTESPSDWSENGMGRCCVKTQTIRINKNMPPENRNKVLLHEIIHAIADENGIGLTETQTSVLATGLFAFLRDNPKIVTKIIA